MIYHIKSPKNDTIKFVVVLDKKIDRYIDSINFLMSTLSVHDNV